MKIAFLTDEFYPTFGANSLVVKTVCEKLIELGHEAYVLPFHCNGMQPAREQWENINICRKVPSDGKNSLKALLKKGRFFRAVKVAASLYRQKKDPHNIFAKPNYMAEEFLCEWLLEEQIDTVVSINCSIELSFPLLRLRKKGKLPCKWFFYMLDPFASHEYYLSHAPEAKLRKLQHGIMTHCDRVLATELIYKDTALWETKTVLEKFRLTEFPKMEKPVYAPAADDVPLVGEGIHIVCTGSKNEAVRNSSFTLALCRNIPGATFHFVGPGWAGTAPVKEDNLIFYPPCSYGAVRNMQRAADFLLNIGNAVANQLPSKVLEYITTGKPVINVYKIDDCPARALLAQWDALNISETESLESQRELLQAFLAEKHSPVSYEDIEARYEKYTPAAVAENFL